MSGLWNIPADAGTKSTPLKLLREQALALSQGTRGDLLGEVDATSMGDSNMVVDFRISIPSLNDYSYGMFKYFSNVADLFNGHIFSLVHKTDYVINGEEQFKEVLKRIITSPETTKIIENLLAQAVDARS